MHTQVVLKVFNGKEEGGGEKLGKLDVGMGRNSYRGWRWLDPNILYACMNSTCNILKIFTTCQVSLFRY